MKSRFLQKVFLLVTLLLVNMMVFAAPSWTYTSTSVSATVVVGAGTVTIVGLPISNGDYIGVFYNLTGGGLGCAGYAIWNGNAFITAYGSTGTNNGFANGEAIKFKVWRASDALELDATPTWGFGGTWSNFGYNIIATLTANLVGISASATQVNATCNGVCNGSVNVSVIGGITPYIYAWSNSATTQNISALCAGTYTVTVTDNTVPPYTTTVSKTITQPSAIIITPTLSNYGGYGVSPFGASNGSISLNVSGGNSPYTYLWSNGSTSANLSSLPAGTYNVTVTDAGPCAVTASYILTQQSLSSGGNATGVSCFGQCNGTINLSVSGGVSPYTYLWTNSATTQNLSNLCSGSYTVTITDSYGTPGSPFNWTYINSGANHTILLPTGVITLNGNPIAPGDYIGVFYSLSGGIACGGYALWTGEVNAESAWGDDALTPEKDGFANNESFQWQVWHAVGNGLGIIVNMTATYITAGFPNQGTFTSGGMSSIASMTGTYTMIPPNTNILSFIVTTPSSALSVSGVATNVQCNGENSGAVNITVSGGTSPYNYLWSNSATTQNIGTLTAGSYSVTVTDAHQCTATAGFTVTQPDLISLSAVILNVFCNGGNNGHINLTVTGGAAPLSYSWSNGATTKNISGLVANAYSVTFTDVNGCTQTGTWTVTQPEAMQLSADVTNVLCNGGTNGAIALSVSGGTTPYIYMWNSGETTQNLTNKHAGTYTVTVTYAVICTSTASYTITQPPAISLSAVTIRW
ncbi:MAG: SprB repeat-containing protein [Bacteroidia bacterium]|nr:SprB repeat-containing protein [Bacteroidia bacterium]